MAVTKGLPRVVRKLCLWCQGQSWRLVKECPQSGCPLHTCRLGGDGDGQLLGCLQAFCLDCAGSQEAVEACTADLPMGGQCPCPAHPFRSLFFQTAEAQAVIQQVRKLPGLGIPAESKENEAGGVCQREGREGASGPGLPEVSLHSEGVCLRVGSTVNACRAPEALDI